MQCDDDNFDIFANINDFEPRAIESGERDGARDAQTSSEVAQEVTLARTQGQMTQAEATG